MSNKWVTFDLDGTLMQNPFVEWVFPEIEGVFKTNTIKAEHHSLNVKEALVEEHIRRMLANNIVQAYDWDNIVQKLFRQYNIQEKVDITMLVNKHTVEGKVYLLEDDILFSLKQLKEKGYKLAAITNGYSKYQMPVLKQLGLSNYFDKVITPERVGAAKPDLKMLTAFEEGEICAHVGDRIDHDVKFANNGGIPSVLIIRSLNYTLKKLSPEERIKHKECRLICQRKWNNELQKSGEELPEHSTPQFVIHSIKELVHLF